MKEEPPLTTTDSRIVVGRFRRLKILLRFFGIIISSGKRHPVHLSFVFFFWLLGLFLVLLAGGIGMYTYSTHPNFCNSCHIMEPYYNAWRTSQHFGKATCVDCHYPPATSLKEHLWHKFQASSQVVKYVTHTYSSKPFAEIEDASCLRSGCHSTRLLEGKVVSAKGIKFDHRPHLMETRRERKLRCVSCHSQIVVGQHFEVATSTCFLCHFKGRGEGKELNPIGGCLGCHDLPSRSFQLGNMTYQHKDFVTKQGVACVDCHLDIVQGQGKAEQERCFTCHNQPEKLERYNDVPFIHENHVTRHHIACLHCHEEMHHGFQETSETLPHLNGPSELPAKPTEIHASNLAFQCSFCHENKHAGPLSLYTGQAASLDLPPMPSPMYRANVDCIGCHYNTEGSNNEKEFKGLTFKASPQACVKCHGRSFAGIFDETQAELKMTLSRLQQKLSDIQTALHQALLPEDQIGRLTVKVGEVDRIANFIRLGRGEHNIYLASAALRKGDQLLSEVATELNLPPDDLSSLPLLSGSFCATMCHSKIGVKVPPETVKVSGKEMPHLMHTTLMSCTSCHQLGAHKVVPLRKGVKEEVCSGCH